MTTLREQLENNEINLLSPLAVKSAFSKGRTVEEKESDIMTRFALDCERIICSKAFRRLKHKTQVFFSPNDDHYRTRMTHTLEVAYVAETIAKAVGLNSELARSIALGHDLGHTPFGHGGETVLNILMKNGFRHNEQSVRVVSDIEKLNLTFETVDGILNHNGDNMPSTAEGKCVKIADRTAYLNHDILDALRAGIIKKDDLPKDCIKFFFGKDASRYSVVIKDIANFTKENDTFGMSEECTFYMNKLRNHLFECVYTNPAAKNEEKKAGNVLTLLFEHYLSEICATYPGIDFDIAERTVCDYISGMTDDYAVRKFNELFVPAHSKITNKDDFLQKALSDNGVCVL